MSTGVSERVGVAAANPQSPMRVALANAPRCGAHSRRTGNPCKQFAMRNGRCRMHGGRHVLSKRAEALENRQMLKQIRELLDSVDREGA